MRSLFVVAIAVMLTAACSDDGGTTTTTTAATVAPPAAAQSSTTTTVTTTTTTTLAPQTLRIPEQLAGLELADVTLDDLQLLVAIADGPEQRRSGLMFVEDLEDLDGMLFIFEEDTSSGFWMRNTLLPLDIAFFDQDGRFVDGFVMEPCTTEECPTYFPEGRYRYALEMEEGTMPESPQGLTLHRGADHAGDG